jgi:hypothetical protein
MAITTNPIFYTIDNVSTNNNLLNFKEPNVSGDELTATLNIGSYSMSQLITELARALNAEGSETYTVTLDRDTRIVTISSTDTLELLVSTGSNSGLSTYSLLGFTGADLTGSSSYDSDTAIGDTYEPQFPLQKFRGFETNKEGIRPSINEAADGTVEVITFGDRQFMEFEIKYTTDNFMAKGAPITNNPTGVADLTAFMDFLITKSNLEFMKDKTVRSTFNVMLLESTRQNRMGVGYQLKEKYSEGLQGYFDTGMLKFRKVQ